MYELHCLLCTLLSQELNADEKLDIIEKEYDIPTETDLKEGMNVMCNLIEGIEEKGIVRGFTIRDANGRAEVISRIYFILLLKYIPAVFVPLIKNLHNLFYYL